jgi:hypothetical protein
MQGFFEINENQYPWLAVQIGNDLVVKNLVTEEQDLREPIAGEYKSDERNAQNERFAARAKELSNISRRESARRFHEEQKQAS